MKGAWYMESALSRKNQAPVHTPSLMKLCHSGHSPHWTWVSL